MMSRDAAVNFKLPTTKPGAIKMMCPMPGFLEIYTPHETFRVRTPESIDPKRTNPNAMWENVKSDDVGSSSPFIARTFIMASEMLRNNALFDGEKCDHLLINMHTIKETLLQCVKANLIYQDALVIEGTAITAHGLKLASNSRAYEKFPIIPNIEAKITAFLVASRRAITEICQIPGHFFTLRRQHSALEYLIKNDLISTLGSDHRLIAYLQTCVDGTSRIINMRNGQEHAATTKVPRLNIRNYEMLPTNQIRQPTWFLDGEEPIDIASEMDAISNFLLDLAETIFVGCIDAVLTDDQWPPLYIEEIEPVDPECPMHYKLSIDPRKLNFPA
jgi:hypothetical protein